MDPEEKIIKVASGAAGLDCSRALTQQRQAVYKQLLELYEMKKRRLKDDIAEKRLKSVELQAEVGRLKERHQHKLELINSRRQYQEELHRRMAAAKERRESLVKRYEEIIERTKEALKDMLEMFNRRPLARKKTELKNKLKLLKFQALYNAQRQENLEWTIRQMDEMQNVIQEAREREKAQLSAEINKFTFRIKELDKIKSEKEDLLGRLIAEKEVKDREKQTSSGANAAGPDHQLIIALPMLTQRLPTYGYSACQPTPALTRMSQTAMSDTLPSSQSRALMSFNRREIHSRIIEDRCIVIVSSASVTTSSSVQMTNLVNNNAPQDVDMFDNFAPLTRQEINTEQQTVDTERYLVDPDYCGSSSSQSSAKEIFSQEGFTLNASPFKSPIQISQEEEKEVPSSFPQPAMDCNNTNPESDLFPDPPELDTRAQKFVPAAASTHTNSASQLLTSPACSSQPALPAPVTRLSPIPSSPNYVSPATPAQLNWLVHPPTPTLTTPVRPSPPIQSNYVHPPPPIQPNLVYPPPPTHSNLARPPPPTQPNLVRPPPPTQPNLIRSPPPTQPNFVHPPPPTPPIAFRSSPPTQSNLVCPPPIAQPNLVRPFTTRPSLLTPAPLDNFVLQPLSVHPQRVSSGPATNPRVQTPASSESQMRRSLACPSPTGPGYFPPVPSQTSIVQAERLAFKPPAPDVTPQRYHPYAPPKRQISAMSPSASPRTPCEASRALATTVPQSPRYTTSQPAASSVFQQSMTADNRYVLSKSAQGVSSAHLLVQPGNASSVPQHLMTVDNGNVLPQPTDCVSSAHSLSQPDIASSAFQHSMTADNAKVLSQPAGSAPVQWRTKLDLSLYRR